MNRALSGKGYAFILARVNDPHSDDDPCVLWPYGAGRYGVVSVAGKSLNAHRVLLQLRDGPAPVGKPHAVHGPCRNGACIIHVHWGTPTENEAAKVSDGTALRGERHHQARLTAADVNSIRLRHSTRRQLLADEFGVTVWHINEIIQRRTWAHLPDPQEQEST